MKSFLLFLISKREDKSAQWSNIKELEQLYHRYATIVKYNRKRYLIHGGHCLTSAFHADRNRRLGMHGLQESVNMAAKSTEQIKSQNKSQN